MARHLPYLNALYFGANTYIDNFRIFVLLTLAWLGIWAATSTFVFLLIYWFPGLIASHAASGIASAFTFNLFFLDLSISNPSMFSLIVLGIALFVIGLIYNLIYQYQLIKLSMALYKSTTLELTNLFSLDREFFLFACARLLLALKFILGLLALVVPGFYLTTKYYFAGFSLIDKTSSSIQEDTILSAQLTNDLLWPVLFVLCMHGITFTGLVPLTILALGCWTFYRPIANLADVHLYYTLKSTQLAGKVS